MNYETREPINWASRRTSLPEGCVTYEPSAVDSFLTEDVYLRSGKTAVRFVSDVRFLLNQKRIERELLPVIDEIVAGARSSELSDAFSHLSDDEIISCVKSRYIQTPSEVKDWSRYLLAEAERLNIPVDVPSEPSADSSSEPSSEPKSD